MTPHTHYPTPAQASRLLTAVADHVTRKSLDGVVYRFQNQAVEIVRRTDTELVIATLDRAQTLRHRTGMVCMMQVPLGALVGAARTADVVGAGLRADVRSSEFVSFA